MYFIFYQGYYKETSIIIQCDIRPDQYEGIDALIASGAYRGISEFMRVAVDNQLLQESAFHGTNPEKIRTENSAEAADSERSILAEVGKPPRPIPVLDHVREAGPTPGAQIGRPLWGQINRFLPVKTALRILANLLASGSGPTVPIREFRTRLGESGRAVGLLLQSRDEAAGRRRSEWLATGFPIGDDPFKSRERYSNQFGLYVRRDGSLDGALARLGFANVNDAALEVGVTNASLPWIAADNPVLDQGELDGPALSDEEIRFLITHLRESFAGEWQLMRAVSLLISNGATRGIIDADLARRYEWSGAEAATMRAGVISRLTELGIVLKERTGTSVKYSLATQAEDFGLIG